MGNGVTVDNFIAELERDLSNVSEDEIKRLIAELRAALAHKETALDSWQRRRNEAIRLQRDLTAARAALEEVMDWIASWDPNFIHDDGWPETQAKAHKALPTPGDEQT